MEFLAQELHYTSSFLRNNLGVEIQGESGNQILIELVDHLELDGFGLMNYHDQYTSPSTLSRRILAECESGHAKGDKFIQDLVLVLFAIICAGLASGLTQGLLSLDILEMQVKSQSGTPIEKNRAARVLPIIKRHHFLLAALILWNAAAAEALPVFLSGLVNEYEAIAISTTLVLLFGEVLPIAVFTGPHQLAIAAFFVPLIYFLEVIFFPVAYPLSIVLDWVIGQSSSSLTVYNKQEISTMLAIQLEEGMRRNKGNPSPEGIQHDEIAIIGGALKYREMKVEEVMTPKETMFLLSVHGTLSYKVRIRIVFKSFLY
jgi:metal transporter CNNM